MNQHTRFNLPICLAVEEDAFFFSDEIIARYIPEIIGQKTLIISEEFLIGIYKEKITDISKDFGNAEIYAMGGASFDEEYLIPQSMPHTSQRRYIYVCRHPSAMIRLLRRLRFLKLTARQEKLLTARYRQP